MFQSVNFCGASGQSYKFEAVRFREDSWVAQAGIMLFTTADGRVVKLSEQFGKVEDIGALWRWREAQRFGATHMYIRPLKDSAVRQAEMEDLNAGLDPICEMERDSYQQASAILPIAA